MPSIKLSERVIQKLAAPDPSGKQVLHWDADLKGFGVLCSGTTEARLIRDAEKCGLIPC